MSKELSDLEIGHLSNRNKLQVCEKNQNFDKITNLRKNHLEKLNKNVFFIQKPF